MGKMSHGGDIYRHKNVLDYSANCNPAGPPAGVVDAIARAALDIGHYPDTICEELTGDLALRHGVTSDMIFMGNGAAEVIYTLALTLNPEKALMPAPTFSEYEDALQLTGCQCIKYHTKKENNYEICPDMLDKITDDIDVVFICNPNNPTGTLTDRELLVRMLRKCEACGTMLILDECFLDFSDDPEGYSLIPELGNSSNLVILKAFTKLYAMAGVRLGYCMTGNKELVAELNDHVQPWNVSVLAQAAGRAALRETDYVTASLEMIVEEKNWLVDQLTQLGIRPLPSQGNYLFFQSRDDLYQQLMTHGIMVRDCSNYDGLSQGSYRIAVKLHEDNLQLIKALKEIL